MEDGVRLYLFSAAGAPLGEVPSYLSVRRMVEQHHDKVFDSTDPAAKAYVEMGVMRFEFGDDVQPQHIRKAWHKFMNYPTEY